jgi:hypothetical protein
MPRQAWRAVCAARGAPRAGVARQARRGKRGAASVARQAWRGKRGAWRAVCVARRAESIAAGASSSGPPLLSWEPNEKGQSKALTLSSGHSARQDRRTLHPGGDALSVRQSPVTCYIPRGPSGTARFVAAEARPVLTCENACAARGVGDARCVAGVARSVRGARCAACRRGAAGAARQAWRGRRRVVLALTPLGCPRHA